MAINTITKDEEILKRRRSELIIRMISYMKPYKKKVALIIMMLVITVFITVFNTYIIKIALDNFAANNNIKALILTGIAMIIINLIQLIISRKRIVDMVMVSSKIVVDMREELYSHIQTLSFSFFDSRPIGKILARIIGDIRSLESFFTNIMTNLIPEIARLIFVFAAMMIINLKLALAAIATLPLLIIGVFFLEGKGRSRWQKFRSKRSNFNGFTHESFSGIKIVQAFTYENRNFNSFTEIVSDMLKSFMNAVLISDMFWPMVEFAWGVSAIVLYWAMAQILNLDNITIGIFVVFSIFIGEFWRPIINISNLYNNIITNFACAERIFDIMDIAPTIKNNQNAEIMPPIKGEVEFKNLSFGYSDKLILNDISFKIKPDTTVALVGPTGAGKTTIVSLISRFYDADFGMVIIDGYDITKVELESLRSQMGIMFQDTFLFSGTIKDNIKYGKLDATDDEIIEKAKAVNAHDFIMKLPQGYDTDVKERGTRLSVGQRQLISFARALLADPKILILDEATSNIDTNTEKLVQEGIKRLLKGRTSFVIAHRLSTIRDADIIMVVDDGKILECGSHEELLKNKGLYYDLCISQYKFMEKGA
ncbi:MAG: ABC transporter ATP-binding protein/permease [Oscillospiraceae bacterium]|nr:ABC transporter ATP-binding protein/permease [Oscillospiraceae bacterium]